MFVRFFASAVDPTDLGEVQRVFAEDVRPVFESLPGCRSIELLVGVAANAGGLIDGAALSRWNSHDELVSAVESRAVAESMVRVMPFLKLEPVVKTFEILE
ncbi:MAG: antibiotic biosynthesis monooxygenase family protein [Acidimicrobiia bacterium]